MMREEILLAKNVTMFVEAKIVGFLKNKIR